MFIKLQIRGAEERKFETYDKYVEIFRDEGNKVDVAFMNII